ncbi:YheC/YheD family protein [Salipaludibacillus sp. CF4.18]|uniref:YheC/YheD family endospore coat-associated protein n=1 Tax=Salipaludibacillus sp. CF4.18 TaxID=3373081 RepID=UPI003EE60041
MKANITDSLGVLVSNRAWKGISKNKPHYRLEKLAEANKEDYFKMFFFSINKVNIDKQVITGYYFDFKNNLWKQGTFPYPEVLYRRGGATKKFKDNYRTFIDQCKKKKTFFLNPSSLGNWDIYNYFSNLKPLKPYLLETVLYEGPEDLFYMMNKHQTIYLKGVTGRKGQNVVRVELLSNNHYQCKYYDYTQQKIYTMNYEQLDDVIPFLDKFYKGKGFMVQEAIDLLELNNRRIDLRAELQRDITKGIQVGGISARVSQENSPITIHSDAIPLDDLFKWIKLSSKEKLKIKKRIESFLCTVYKETEDKYGEFGEIGIDFGLTKDLEIKFIECNSQSAKVSLLKAYGEKTLMQSMQNILSYAKGSLLETRSEEDVRDLEADNGNKVSNSREEKVTQKKNKNKRELCKKPSTKIIQKKIKYKRPTRQENTFSTTQVWFVSAGRS